MWLIEALVKVDGIKSRWTDYGYRNKVHSGHKLIRRIRRETGYRQVEIVKVSVNEEDITEGVKQLDESFYA